MKLHIVCPIEWKCCGRYGHGGGGMFTLMTLLNSRCPSFSTVSRLGNVAPVEATGRL